MNLPELSRSPWQHNVARPRFPSLKHDLQVDVVIVGAGITGLTTALHLVAAGKSVAILERRHIADGVTGSTTAHLTEVLDTRYKTIEDDFGADGARLVAMSSRAAIDSIEKIAREQNISCDFARVPGFLFSESTERDELERELRSAEKAGVAASFAKALPLRFMGAALRFENQAQFHPGKYVMELAQKLPSLAVQIFEDTAVLEIEESSPHRVHTPHGIVTADHVVVATHSPLTRMALQTKLARYQSYVLAFTSKEKLPPGLFWDTEDPYHYIRSQEDGAVPLILVGGEDRKTGQDDHAADRFSRLLDYAQSRFSVDTVHYKWSSQVVEPVDGLPYIGPLSAGSSIYCATGFSGNGMTFGTLAGEIVSDAITGRSNPYAELYSPSRIKALAAVKDFVVENADVPVHLAERVVKHVSAPPRESLSLGQGSVVRDGARLLAVYRDGAGCDHALDPVCPHMGCLVKFNGAENTWDCPCHGSRFDLDGNVLAGPAMKGLAPADSEETPPTVAIPVLTQT